MNNKVNEPKYDEDVVNLGYLNKVLDNDIPEKVAIITTRNYNVQPSTPYYVGDTWTQGSNGNIYRCIKQRLVGEYNSSDWELATGSPSKEDYSALVRKVDLMTEQLDSKIESYYQDTDPAEEWATYTEKEKHVGDLWYDTTTNVSRSYMKDGTTYKWEIRDVPNNLYDKIDTKKSIYTSKPSSYQINDMWIISEEDTDIPTGYATGDILIANTTSDLYDSSHWSKKDNYTPKDYVDKQNTETIENIKSEIENTYKPSILDTAKANAKEQIDSFNTGEVVKQNGKYYIIDAETLEKATNVLVLGAGGIAGSNSGVNGQYNTAITNDGKINADMILTGALLASMIKGGTLTLGGLDNTNGNFQLLDANSNKLIEMNNLGIVLSNGAKLIGGNGVLSNFTFDTGNYEFIGFSNYDGTKQFLELTAFIPNNFVITEAHIMVEHAPIYWKGSTMGGSDYWGYARNVKLYKHSNSDKYYRYGITSGGYQDSSHVNLSEITNAFGANGFTGSAPSTAPSSSMSDTVTKITSTDIKNQLSVGKYNTFRIQSSLDTMTPVGDLIEQAINEKTGIAKATLCVIGYIK